MGGLGGRRVEHTFANLGTGLGLEKRGLRLFPQNERSRITYVLPGQTRRYPKEAFFSTFRYFRWKAVPKECMSVALSMS